MPADTRLVSDPVIIVLGAKLYPDGTPSVTLKRRSACAAALWHEIGGTLLPTGGPTAAGESTVTEAEAIEKVLRASGVPRAHILSEPRARTTWENAVYCRDLLSDRAHGQIYVVTDSYHCLRSHMAFARAGLRVKMLSASRHPPAPRALVTAKQWLRECAAIPVYALKLAFVRG